MKALVFGLLSVAVQVQVQAADPKPVEINGFAIPVPEGWVRQDDPSGTVMFHPPLARGFEHVEPQFFMFVIPTQPLKGTFWETHRATFDESVKAMNLTNTVAPIHDPSAPGPFVRSSTAGDDRRKSIRAVRLYSARSEGGIDSILMFGSEDFGTTGPMLHHTRVRKPPKAAPRPKIGEAYRRLEQQLDVHVNRGEMLVGAAPYARILLRDDGVADFMPVYDEGYAACPAPQKVDRALQRGRYGSWKAVGDQEIHIIREAGKPAEVYRRENGKLRIGDKVWDPMPLVDGLKLDGAWRLPGAKQKRIEFTPAGRFKDEGLLEDVGFWPVYAWAGSRIVTQQRPPPRGAGSYEIREFTLLLKYDDGLAWSTDFSIEGTDPKDLSKLLLRTGKLERDR
jgi:hypothetical protein